MALGTKNLEAQYAKALQIGKTPEGFNLLKQAALGQNDDFDQVVANMALRQLTQVKTAADGVKAQQQLAQGKQTVAQKNVQAADQALPEMSGIGQLPAPNMEALAAAQGGIMSYADGGEVAHFDEGGYVTLNGVRYQIDPATGKVLYNGVLTDPKLLQQSAKSEWNTVKPLQLSGADYKPSTKEWLGEQNTERDQKYFSDQRTMREDIAGGKGINWKGNYYPIIQEGAGKGKVDYNGVPTAMNMFPGAEGAVPAMPTATPWKSDSPAATLAQAEAPAAPSPDKDKDKGKGKPTPGVDALLGKDDKVAPAALRLAQPGQAVEDPTKAQERTRDQRLSDVKELMKALRGERGDEFADVKAQLQEDKKALETMKSEGLGYMLLAAAGAGLEPGKSTATAIGGMLRNFGETGIKYQPQLLAARQGISSGQQRLAEAQAAAERGDMQTAATLSGQFSTEDIARAKMAQDRELGLAQISASRAAAGRNTQLELIQALQKNPELLKTYQGMHEPQEKPLNAEAINKSFNERGAFMKNPATGKVYTLPEWAAELRRVYGNMTTTSSLSAADQALVNKYAK